MMYFPRFAQFGCLALLLAVFGCSGDATQRYVQEPDNAKAALEAALTAWKNGEPHGTIEFTEDEDVDVIDARWRDGQQIENFTIVEELPGDPHPQFKVNLRFKDALEDEQSMFLVVGINPILIYRAEDYQAASGM